MGSDALPPATPQPSGPGLLRRVAGGQLVWWVAAVTAVFAVFGMTWLTTTTRQTAETAALHANTHRAAAFAQLAIGREVGSLPMGGQALDGATKARLDTLVQQTFTDPAVGMAGSVARLLAPDGRILYTTLGEQETARMLPVAPLGPNQSRARFRGTIAGEPDWGRAFEVDLALGGADAPLVLHLTGPAALVTDETAGVVRRAQLQEIVAVALLWASQVGVVLVLSRRLRRNLRRSDYLAFHDVLTGLPNRALFSERLLAAVSSASETGGRAGLLLIDLNRFKELNDTLGHHSGDAVLREVATIIAGELRTGDLVARLGGDEFAVLIDRPRHLGDVEAVAERVARRLASTPQLGELAVTVDAAIGVTAFPDHGGDAATLMRKADLAMYAAKALRRPWQRYEDSITAAEVSTLTLPTELRTALSSRPEELLAHYQPIVDGRNNVVAVEALARWRHPTRGLLGAREFVPLAERIGIGGPLCKRMIEIVLSQAKEWADTGLRLPIALNVGESELHNEHLAQDISRGLEEHGLGPSAVIVEVTQSALRSHDRGTSGLVASLRRQGVAVALDDFGGEASSVTALRDVPADILKLDRGLLTELSAAGATTEIVRSTISLAHHLGMLVVAEGVDRLDQVDVLVRCGCDWLQGRSVCGAMPAEELVAWLEARPTSVAPALTPAWPALTPAWPGRDAEQPGATTGEDRPAPGDGAAVPAPAPVGARPA